VTEVDDFESIVTPVPGPRSRELAQTLRAYEAHKDDGSSAQA
jgi:hypothetical protein